MNADFVAAIIVAFTTLTLLISETHVAFVTLALTSGYVLSEVVGSETSQIIRDSVDVGTTPVESIVRIVLLLLPAVLIAIRFRRSQRGFGRVIQQVVPSFALALVLVVFVYQNLPSATQASIDGDSYLSSLLPSYGNLLVVFAIATALFDVVLQHAGPKRKYKKRGRGKKDED